MLAGILNRISSTPEGKGGQQKKLSRASNYPIDMVMLNIEAASFLPVFAVEAAF